MAEKKDCNLYHLFDYRKKYILVAIERRKYVDYNNGLGERKKERFSKMQICIWILFPQASSLRHEDL